MLQLGFSKKRVAPSCQLCGLPNDSTHTHICSSCQSLLPRNHTHCQRCALPMASPGVCGPCQTTPQPIEHIIAPYRFEFPMAQCVQQFKNQSKLWRLNFLADEFVQGLSLAGRPWPDVIIPIPSHTKRHLKRGYCHTTLLAKRIGQITGIPVDCHLVRRTRYQQPQSQMSRAQRLKLSKSHFSLREPATLQGQRVALLDDVVTTGRTLKAVAERLQPLKPKSIQGWALCRTPNH